MSLAPSLLFFVCDGEDGAYAALPLRSQAVTYEEYARACSLAERLPNHPSPLPQEKRCRLAESACICTTLQSPNS